MVSETETLNVSDSARALEIIFGKPDNGMHSGAVPTEKQRRVQYWRKPEYEGATDSGWIIVGPEVRTDAPGYKRMIDRGWKQLPERFGLQVTGQSKSTMSWEGNHKLKSAAWLEPFIAAGGLTYIIQHNDTFGPVGSYLIPAEQLVTYGLHRRPGIKDVRPDLHEAVDLQCPERCINDRRQQVVFSGINQEEAQKSLDQHMAAKHRDSGAARAIGAEILKAQGVFNAPALDANMIAAIAAAVAQTMQAMAAQTSPAAPVAVEVPVVEVCATPDEDAPAQPAIGIDLDTARRPDMMQYAKSMGLKTLPLSAKTDEWREYLREQLAS